MLALEVTGSTFVEFSKSKTRIEDRLKRELTDDQALALIIMVFNRPVLV